MTFSFSRIRVYAAMIAFGSLAAAGPAHAEIVRSTDGAPVLSSNGNCVISNWEGSEGCDAAKAAAGEAVAPAQMAKVEHEGVVYFDFNKATLSPQAKHTLDHIAKKLHMLNKRDHGATTITVVGYADRLGNADYDQKLALKRAQAVRAYLLSKGVKAHKLEIRSLGKSDPRAHCPDGMPKPKLIKCLREDRRVEIEISGKE